MRTSLPVLVHVYNEQHVAYIAVQRIKVLETSSHLDRIEGLSENRRENQAPRSGRSSSDTKGTEAKATGSGPRSNKATCEICVINDADLEYHFKNLLRIMRLIEEQADAV